MVDSTQKKNSLGGDALPFPVDWVKTQPRKVEDILSGLSVEEQVRCILGLDPQLQQNILILSEKAVEVTQSLPVEEVYNLIKEVEKEDSLLVLSMASPDQLQYFFDVEWWQGDKFKPERALDWIVLLDECQDPDIFGWFLGEDFDQKVILLQAFIKVYKQDEMTDSYEGVEGLEHFSPDGVYDIFFKIENSKEIKKLLLLIMDKDSSLLYSLLEAVIWYPVSLTLEKAYHWRTVRAGERGIPEFQEAMGLYSRLDPEMLKVKVPSLEDLPSSQLGFSPRYLLANVNETLFFSQCLAILENESRLETLRWELVCLANKVIVADQLDLSSMDVRHRALRKAIGYINIGLELGAEGNLAKGSALLDQVWMQSFFQVGYEQLRQIRSSASAFINKNGAYIENFISARDKERMGALVFQFPQVMEKLHDEDMFNWRDPESLIDIQVMNDFISRWVFYSRFARKGLGLNESIFSSSLSDFDYPEPREDLNLLTLLTTALARYALFGKISCDPLPDVAAKSFLEMIFLPGIFQEETRVCNEDLIASFEQALLKSPLAWTDLDKTFLHDLVCESSKNLEDQFGNLDLSRPIEWKFAQGLCIYSAGRGAKEQ
ncbi:MAG TPA: hypothetical protein EYF96_04010 [Nitrospinaceae bacterium]|nr:hypothetical protein [Nitrospinaceae bacterium]